MFFMFSSKSSTHVYTASMWKSHIERSQKAVDLVRGIIRAYWWLFFVMLQWIPHHSLPPRIQRIQNAECPTSMRVGNITPAAEILCQIPTIWTPWRLRYFFQLTTSSWDVSKPLIKQLCLTIYSRDIHQTYHLVFHHIMFNHECAVFQLIGFTHQLLVILRISSISWPIPTESRQMNCKLKD